MLSDGRLRWSCSSPPAFQAQRSGLSALEIFRILHGKDAPLPDASIHCSSLGYIAQPFIVVECFTTFHHYLFILVYLSLCFTLTYYTIKSIFRMQVLMDLQPFTFVSGRRS